jgi:hypothetical protein
MLYCLTQVVYTDMKLVIQLLVGVKSRTYNQKCVRGSREGRMYRPYYKHYFPATVICTTLAQFLCRWHIWFA